MSTALIVGSDTKIFHFAIINGEKPMQVLPGLMVDLKYLDLSL